MQPLLSLFWAPREPLVRRPAQNRHSVLMSAIVQIVTRRRARGVDSAWFLDLADSGAYRFRPVTGLVVASDGYAFIGRPDALRWGYAATVPGSGKALVRIICGAVQQPLQSTIFRARAVRAQKLIHGRVCRASTRGGIRYVSHQCARWIGGTNCCQQSPLELL